MREEERYEQSEQKRGPLAEAPNSPSGLVWRKWRSQQRLQTERGPLIKYSLPWEDGKSSDNTTFFKEVI